MKTSARRLRLGGAGAAVLALVAGLLPGPLAHAEKVPFSIDPVYAANFEREFTTQFPSRYTNQQLGTAWRIGHDAAALYIRDEWSRLLEPFKDEGAFSELRPFNFVDPLGLQPDNQDPVVGVGPENNVLAFMPGSDPILKNQIVVVGGHYDCVDETVDGGIDCGMQIPASTAVLEGFVRYWQANNLRPRRSLMMFAIDGEEQCLCGSVHYTTLGSVNALFHHLELPPAATVVAYHDTDMIGANYPNRLFGLSSNDFMPLMVNSAPTVEDPARVLAPFASYYGAIANPVFLARFRLYREAVLRQRDRFFKDMNAKYPTWTYRDGVTKPLFTEEQKKYINVTDDPLNRSDHTVFIANGIPGELNIGLSDLDVAPPGLVAYHQVGETQEELYLLRGGTMSLGRDALLGYEATSMWVAYLSGAGEDSPATEPFFLGETAPAEGLLPIIEALDLDVQTAVLPEMPATQTGGTWRKVGLEDTIVRALAIDPRDPRTLYVSSQDRGFLVSRDGGRTFAESNRGLGPYTSLWHVATDPSRPGRIWASTHHGGLFRSDDGGRSWGTPRAAAASVARVRDVVYAAPMIPVNSAQVLMSNITIDQTRAETAGMWLYGYDQCLPQFAPPGQDCSTRVDWPPEGFDKYPMVLDLYRYASEAAVMGDGSVLGAGFHTNISGGGIFRTEDDGGLWDYRWENGAGEEPGSSNLWRVRAAAGGERAYAAGTGGVFVSNNAGKTWEATGIESSEVRALAVDPVDPDVAYAGSWNAAGGVFKTTNGGKTWEAVNNGIPDRAGIAALEVDPKNPNRVAAATYWYGVYLSTDGGASWKLAAEGMPDEVRQRLDDVDFAPDGTLYASSHHGIWALGGPTVLPGTFTPRPRPRTPAAPGAPLPGTGVGGGPAALVLIGLAFAVASWRRRVA